MITIPLEYAPAIAKTDHTALGFVDIEMITSLCHEAAAVEPFPNSVCIQGPVWTQLAHELLIELDVRDEIKVCGVGQRQFPMNLLQPFLSGTGNDVSIDAMPGGASLEQKKRDLLETIEFIDIFDMVMNVRHILENRLEEAVLEIHSMFHVLFEHRESPELRVICSTGLLRDLQGDEGIQKACMVMDMASREKPLGGLVMKTETGFVVDAQERKYGAELEDIRLMRSHLPDAVKIKASGGVNRENVLAFIKAGADYIGASSLLREFIPNT
jgi:deoxyribose-phosphate aldolase